MKRASTGGISLAKVLIVVALILVVIALAVPVYAGTMDNEKIKAAREDISLVKAAATTKYILDNEVGPKTYQATIDTEGNIGPIVEGSGAATTPEDIKDERRNKEILVVVEVVETDAS